MAGRPVSLAPRPPMLAGREELLAGLHARLSEGAAGGPRIIALYGLGGAGKTSVAVEYAHRHQAAAGVVWQFPAEDSAVLAAEFARLAGQLGAGGGLLDRRDPVASVHAVLAAAATAWLLVFDNAPDLESVRAFLPPAGNGGVLITSQSALWPPGQSMEVPVLGIGAAAGFLTARTGDPDERAARELADELGGLPLALEQAAAYVHATGNNLAGYLASFRQRRPALLGRGEPTGYGKTVATTWALAFSRLEHSAPGAVGLLRLLACCAPEAVPWRLLLTPTTGLAEKLGPDVAPVLGQLLDDRLTAGEAVAALRRYSLVSPVADGLVLVHRLVRAVTADRMPADLARQWQQATAALVGAALPADPWLPRTWPVYAMLLPHVQAAVPADSAAAAAIADYLGERGSYAAAREGLGRVLEARERRYGPEHPDTLIARRSLAHWTGQAGDPATARDQLAQLLPVAERLLGPEHPDTLSVRHELAWRTGEAGDAVAARDQYAALVPMCERVLGPEHRHTLSVRQGLAAFTGRAGDWAAARDQSAVLLPLYQRVLGPEYPGTLGIQANLAGWTGKAGDLAAARRLYAELLTVSERVFGPEHPGTLATQGGLAAFTGEAGDAAAARDQFATLVPVRQQVLGPEHPETLATRGELAGWTGEAGDAAAARDQFAALVPVHERVLGAEHPQTLDTRAALARWTGEAGDAAAARDQLAELLPIYEPVLGAEHPETLATRDWLDHWTRQAADRRPFMK